MASAHCLASAGQKTLLFDGDLGLANVDIQLGLMPQHDLGEVIGGRSTMEAVVSRADAVGFDIIAGRSGSGGLSALPQARLQMLVDELTVMVACYDKAILDLGAGLEGTVRTLAASADTVLVVATDEPTSLTDAYAFIKLVLKQDPRADLRVVVNMAASRPEGERTYATLRKACTSFLKADPPLAGVIRRDPKVKDAIRNDHRLRNADDG